MLKKTTLPFGYSKQKNLYVYNRFTKFTEVIKVESRSYANF